MTSCATTSDLLNQVQLHFETGASHKAMRLFVDGLKAMRSRSADWQAEVSVIRAHPATQRAYSCPFTRHAAARPYGYPGDAELIDYIYGYASPPEDASARAIFRFTTTSPACRAVRYRCTRAAQLINQTVHEVGATARIASVACGRFRELELSTALPLLPGGLVGLDQDQNSLDAAQTSYGHLGLTTIRKNIADLIVGRHRINTADLIYSTGLYDYLSVEVAQKLTQNLFQSLRTGGRLVLVNFTSHVQDVGYMEAVMDWWLIYRDEKAMLELLSGIPKEYIANVEQYRDPAQNLTFLEVVRR